MTTTRTTLKAWAVGLALLAAGLAGCDKTPEVQMIAAGVPKPDYPAECTAPSPAEPAPRPEAERQGFDGIEAAREHRRTLEWGRDVAGMRMVCRAWISAYVAQRWPDPAAPAAKRKPLAVASAGGG